MKADATRLATTLKQLSITERRDQVACAVIEDGGIYPEATPGFRLFELQLYGISATGMGEDQAIANWITAALTPAIRATDGRPDCPYNGQGLAPETPRTATA
jgi:hypothetical protein